MTSEHEFSTDEEVNTVSMGRPHVIILGAGASRATCPEGDKNGKQLPLMTDFADIVGLKPILQEWGINPEQNFENIFSDLHENKENEKLRIIEHTVENYFEQLELPDSPTLYDHLVLSLREKDLIASFNWDPLLLQAHLRNRKSDLTLPHLVFLHGNVMTGYCESDKRFGLFYQHCSICQKPFKRTPLLYPIKKKDYANNSFIKDEWNVLKQGIQNTFMMTIFGYGAPKTDTEAISLMQQAYGDAESRQFEETTFISTQSEDDVYNNWKSFIHSHHYQIHNNFYDSYLANHPRRTGETYWAQYLEARFANNNPIPRELNFPELWKWFEKFKKAEDEHKLQKNS